MTDKEWQQCKSAADRIADLVYFGDEGARTIAPTITWADIIGENMGFKPNEWEPV